MLPFEYKTNIFIQELRLVELALNLKTKGQSGVRAQAVRKGG